MAESKPHQAVGSVSPSPFPFRFCPLAQPFGEVPCDMELRKLNGQMLCNFYCRERAPYTGSVVFEGCNLLRGAASRAPHGKR